MEPTVGSQCRRSSSNSCALQDSWRDCRADVSHFPAHLSSVRKRTPRSVSFDFHARDVHLVMGPLRQESPVRFRVSIDGQRPGSAHGLDVDNSGSGTVIEQRLYQLIRQRGPIVDRTFEIEFLDTGVEAFAFTFG